MEYHDAGRGIRIKIFGQRWNRNQNRNHLDLESELESALVELESVKKKEQINVGRGCLLLWLAVAGSAILAELIYNAYLFWCER